MHSRDLPGDDKSIALRDVVEIRRGNDPDPDHPGMYGTATLRRHPPKPNMMENCFSLVLRDRYVFVKLSPLARLNMSH